MEMNDTFTMTLACLAGLMLGCFFFGGLWWTIRRGLSSPHPALWFSGSLVVRMAVTLAGFFFVSGGSGMRLLACLAGFMAGRLGVTWFTRERGKEADHAH
jgi:F1F0 ATPase subunit 2